MTSDGAVVPKTPNGPHEAGRSLCSESRARTCDPLINSQLLCQLSYLGMARKEDSKRLAASLPSVHSSSRNSFNRWLRIGWRNFARVFASI